MTRAQRSRISVVVATYDWPEALDMVLQSLSEQRDAELEVIVADDGSGSPTAAVVAKWEPVFRERLRHVWQPDQGWRLGRCRNAGALAAHGDFLVFLDGDCLVRPGFAAAIRRAALPGWFLAGKRLHLSAALSKRVLEDDQPLWRWSAASWVARRPRELLTSHRESGGLGLLVPLRDRRRPWRPRLPDFSPPFDAYGFFLGIRRADFEHVNGFDVRFESWGGEDVDIARRLTSSGLRCGWPGPAATLLHLYHPPRKGTMASNAGLLLQSDSATRVIADHGLREVERDLESERQRCRGGAPEGTSTLRTS